MILWCISNFGVLPLCGAYEFTFKLIVCCGQWFDFQSTAAEWRIVFLIIAATCVVTGMFFQYFGSATIQQWAVGGQMFLDKRASTFTLHVEPADSYLSINNPESYLSSAHPEASLKEEGQTFSDNAQQQKLLAIPARMNRRSPRVSIMEEDGEIVRPGEDDEEKENRQL